MNKPIKAYDLQGLKTLFSDLNVAPFRAQQLYEWLYTHHAKTYDEMTNLPKALREQLLQLYPIGFPDIVDKQVSRDGTRKYVLRLFDGSFIETVGIPSKSRLTVCFSTQSGCPVGCLFCATGSAGFERNLYPGEIVDQVAVVEEDFNQRATNVVGMGQGEPFLNFNNVLNALKIINEHIGARHITVSTCGIIPGIKRFSAVSEQFTLAVSLHAATQNVRDKIMPGASQYSLLELRNALQAYITKSNRRVTFEYLLMQGINDKQEDLEALIEYCSGLLCHVNLLPLNAVQNSPFIGSNKQTQSHWLSTLYKHHIPATLRESRGSDIAGACGQLKTLMFHVKHKG